MPRHRNAPPPPMGAWMAQGGQSLFEKRISTEPKKPSFVNIPMRRPPQRREKRYFGSGETGMTECVHTGTMKIALMAPRFRAPRGARRGSSVFLYAQGSGSAEGRPPWATAFIANNKEHEKSKINHFCSLQFSMGKTSFSP